MNQEMSSLMLFRGILTLIILGFTRAGAPTVNAGAYKNPAKPGDSVQIECHAKAYPTPNISWYRNNVKLPGQNIKIMQAFNLSASRYTFTAQPDSGGPYECRASNGLPDSNGHVIIKTTVTMVIESVSTTAAASTTSSTTAPSSTSSSTETPSTAPPSTTTRSASKPLSTTPTTKPSTPSMPTKPPTSAVSSTRNNRVQSNTPPPLTPSKPGLGPDVSSHGCIIYCSTLWLLVVSIIITNCY